MHHWIILHRRWHRTKRQMTGLHIAHAEAVNRFGALRQWWAYERRWSIPLVEVVEIRHACPPHGYERHYYICEV